jgi:uncharacterized DUF497 family protein
MSLQAKRGNLQITPISADVPRQVPDPLNSSKPRQMALAVATIRIYTTSMKFVWDPKKNREDIRRHGIDFRDATELFNHPMLVRLDTRQEYGEDQWIGIGLLRSRVAVVVYIEWEDEETIRIISARKATAYETGQYYERLPH